MAATQVPLRAAQEPVVESPPPQKPRLRGVSHQFAAIAAVPTGVLLVIMAPSARAAWGAAVYALSLTWLLAVSAVYHVPMWQPRIRQWLRRLDHASIFVLIAGTMTPVCLLGLPEAEGNELLVVAWVGALLGVLQSLVWIRAPRWVSSTLYVGLGFVAIPYLMWVNPVVPVAFVWLMLLGGVLYTAGAVIYAAKRPNPWPGVFGYHEVFHALVILASVAHFSAVVLLVRGRL